MLEVLIAILILSFGMLGLAGMQAYAIAAHRNAAYRAIAASLASELAELMRVNRAGLSAGNYDVAMLSNTSPPATAPCAYPACNDAATLAAADLTDFQRRVRDELPSGGIKVARPAGATREADLWVLWDEPQVLNHRKSDGSSAESTIDSCPVDVAGLNVQPRCFYMKVQL